MRSECQAKTWCIQLIFLGGCWVLEPNIACSTRDSQSSGQQWCCSFSLFFVFWWKACGRVGSTIPDGDGNMWLLLTVCGDAHDKANKAKPRHLLDSYDFHTAVVGVTLRPEMPCDGTSGVSAIVQFSQFQQALLSAT